MITRSSFVTILGHKPHVFEAIITEVFSLEQLIPNALYHLSDNLKQSDSHAHHLLLGFRNTFVLWVSVHRSMQSAIKFSQIAAIFDVGDKSIDKEFMKSPHMYHCRRRIQYDIYIRFSNFVRELPNPSRARFQALIIDLVLRVSPQTSVLWALKHSSFNIASN